MKQTHYNSLAEILAKAVADGYLTNDNIKNFVCFGPGAESGTCNTNNLYRIIGVFNGQVKLIKYDYADTTMLGEDGDYYQTTNTSFLSGKLYDVDTNYLYYWNYSNGTSSTNDWSTSRLNTVNLNTNYWNYLTSNWQNKIVNTTWQIGGNNYENIIQSSVKITYESEISNPMENLTYQDEIGLMYMSDYMYAVSPSHWTKPGFDDSSSALDDYRGVKSDLWMYAGFADWTIFRRADRNNQTGYIGISSGVNTSSIYENTFSVRPAFYLNTDVEIYEGHAGTKSDPYRIVL